MGVYTHIHDGILLSHKKEQNWAICDVDRSRVCHRVKSVRKTKTSIVQQSMHLECRKMVTDEPVCRAGTEKKTEQICGHGRGWGREEEEGRQTGTVD